MSEASTTVAGVKVATDHYIDGRRVSSADRFLDSSPIDGSSLGEISAGGAAEAEMAVEAARRAFPAWAALGPAGRLPVLQRFAAGILARSKDLAAVETVDNGSLLSGNEHRVVARSALNISYFAEHALTLRDHRIDSPEVVNHVRYDPAGVAVLVTPWNAPLMLSTWKIGPALAAGNTAIVKPPEWAPLTCSLLADIAHEAGVPSGVLNIVQGLGSQAGSVLTTRMDVDRISFTGSTATARVIGAAAANSITPVSFELGGKSPFIVYADADLEAAAQTVAGQYTNAGQICLAGTRLFVEASIAERFIGMVRAATEKTVVGDPRNPATRVGPLIHPVHAARVAGFVDRAKADGLDVLWGGERHAAGELYFQPTMLAGAGPAHEIYQSEVFGPVLIVGTFTSDDEVIEAANSTKYGLAAVLFTGSESRARKIAEAVVAGTVWVNCFFVRELAAPFGGARHSGIGREGGTWSFDFFCNIKNIAIRKGSLGGVA